MVGHANTNNTDQEAAEHHQPAEQTNNTVVDHNNDLTSEKHGRKVERSNSRVTKVSNLIKWPKSKDKDKSSAANLYVSDTSQV